MLEPAEGVIEVVEQRVDDCDLVRRNPVLVTLADYVVENGLRFFMLADGGEHVGSFRISGWRVAGKATLLLKRSHHFIVHALAFVRPTQNGVCRNGAGIEFKGFATLFDALVELTREKQQIGRASCRESGSIVVWAC